MEGNKIFGNLNVWQYIEDIKLNILIEKDIKLVMPYMKGRTNMGILEWMNIYDDEWLLLHIFKQSNIKI